MTTTDGDAEHPRSRRARRAILSAAADLLEEAGFRSMAMDAVVARAHASKATLYRNWPTKAALAMDAFMAEVDPASPFPDTGSVVEDIRRSVAATVQVFTRPRVRQMLLGVLVELPHDRELRDAYGERYVVPRRRQAEAAVRRGIARGEVSRDAGADILFDEIYGAIYLRLLLGSSPLDAAFVDALVSQVFEGVLIG
ncbi:TetR/AcrR family transcriptional regulator [Humibacter albus]|uniref:TetR/AcrR family transcriptional regulator n=1 Tax=Humibacter albus TaxID=427754 RepID=UPI0003B3CB35|nr:TetR/AcrR family transcriptional regulator [Humibacter albus]